MKTNTYANGKNRHETWWGKHGRHERNQGITLPGAIGPVASSVAYSCYDHYRHRCAPCSLADRSPPPPPFSSLPRPFALTLTRRRTKRKQRNRSNLVPALNCQAQLEETLRQRYFSEGMAMTLPNCSIPPGFFVSLSLSFFFNCSRVMVMCFKVRET